jgi:hypothetical protein
MDEGREFDMTDADRKIKTCASEGTMNSEIKTSTLGAGWPHGIPLKSPLARSYKKTLSTKDACNYEHIKTKIAVFWVVAPCSLVEVLAASIIRAKLLSDYTTLQPRRQPSSYSPP